MSNCWLATIGVVIAACGAPRVNPAEFYQNGHADHTLRTGTLRGPKDAGYSIDIPIALCRGDATLLRFSPRPGRIEVMQSAFSCPTTSPIENEVLTSDQFFLIEENLKQTLVSGLEAAGFIVDVGETYASLHLRFRRNEWYGEIYVLIEWGWRAYYAVMQQAKVAGRPTCWDPRTKTLPSFVSPTKAPSQFAPDCE